jgi:uncharacterized membrane protein YhhN
VIAATIICALAVVALVYGEYVDADRIRFVAKPLASAAFIAVGLIAGGDHAYATWICVGLVLGALGDIALLFERGFLGGLVVFLAGHVAYCVAFGQLVPARAWLRDAGVLAVVPAVVAAIALAWMWRGLGNMRGPVVAYVLVIVVMVVAALAVARPIVVAGACLFFASDLAVARDKFVARSFVNRAWGLPAYYAAQLLLAWSLAA